ncbi:hypothetical protein BU25DRAFT_415478 [Macroventuria anomochaeta]|uniref:Uncharacterized protein n=1 Tax=Macroventuria anomochaeta TaxID=301207 RepID=A0ACB6RK32_9PLEO|nr:uncharacterized protein BU25DRAFT_415478 [Macroventuria anomochaeta]KAF2622129.1 hypothetical protein BU25DRAFT_415478 [Macroventuria anomochaeta]
MATVYQRNVWPTGQVAIGVVVQLAAGMISDPPLLKGRRWRSSLSCKQGLWLASAYWPLGTSPIESSTLRNTSRTSQQACQGRTVCDTPTSHRTITRCAVLGLLRQTCSATST